MLSIALTAAALSGLPAGWTSNVVYRVTPVNYTGLVNMDSSDPAGDVMFGLNQLLLPFMCPLDPDFLWCQNRQYLSGGSAHMVYSNFHLDSRDAFGEYSPCNPNQTTGVFQCMHWGGSSGPVPGVPKQCSSKFEVFNYDCLNGTIYDEVTIKDEGSCCEACTSDTKCVGWNMPDGNGTNCQLLTEPLINWNQAQMSSKCKAGVKSSGYGPDCWYDDREYNKTFNDYCSRSECQCKAIVKLSVGRETDAMCHRRSSSVAVEDPRPNTPYWECNDQLFQHCVGTSDCVSCAEKLQIPSCTSSSIHSLCHAEFRRCNETIVETCGMKDTNDCRNCAFASTDAMQMGHCNTSYVNYACEYNAPSKKSDIYSDWIESFACMMKGTWYSSTIDGYCNGTITDDCWWNVNDPIRTVNQTCVDGNVVDTVYNYNSTCFQSCSQPRNISTNCVVDCLFSNILGLDGGAPIKPQTLTDAFLKSFSETDPAKGGCPEVIPPSDN